ncbi:conserved hypothetical protein [Ricinus communis]|uniref:Uncharacterized protein n=1 Tax=Ricinus communis TaxID=3988 RepID=B9SE35_RICCO|nr:conserved hypothetical protein [Ricinus communis]
MAVPKGFLACLLLLMIAAMFHQSPRGGEARTLTLKQGNTKKFFATLGLECKCCDGAHGECRSSWESSCPKLQCHPWKAH